MLVTGGWCPFVFFFMVVPDHKADCEEGREEGRGRGDDDDGVPRRFGLEGADRGREGSDVRANVRFDVTDLHVERTDCDHVQDDVRGRGAEVKAGDVGDIR